MFWGFSIINIVVLICSYLGAYYRNLREYDEFFRYEYEKRSSLVFKHLYLCKSNEDKIRKITKEAEIGAMLQFAITQCLALAIEIISNFIFINEKFFYYLLLIMVALASIAQSICYHFISKKSADIAQKSMNDFSKYNQLNLDQQMKKALRDFRKMNENKHGRIEIREEKSFWVQHIFWDLYDEHHFVQTIAQSKKFRYSELKELKIYNLDKTAGGANDDTNQTSCTERNNGK